MTTKSKKSDKITNVKMRQAHDVPEIDEQALKDQAITDATKLVETTRQAWMDAKSELRKLTGKKDKEPKSPGVIVSILSLVTNSGKTGISKDEIVNKLVELFPDRNRESMSKTVGVQLPGRLSKERNVKIEKTDKGNFILVK